MSSAALLILYALMVIVQAAVDLQLLALNLHYARSHVPSVPPLLVRHLDEATYQRSIEYTLAKGRFGAMCAVYSTIMVLVLITGGVLGAIDLSIGRHISAVYLHGVLALLSIALLFSLVGLPLGLYSTFVIEQRFGFNKMTFKLWLIDLFKGLLVSGALMIPLLYGLLWFMDAAGNRWWIYAFLFVGGFQLLVMYLYPVLIAPLFNKFTPLQEGALRDAIYAVADRAGFKTSGIFVMDGSKRSAHGNAYFTGLGKVKRIVFFDTLLSSLKDNETVAVLAHEIGHEKLGHVKKGIALSLFMTFVGFWVLNKLVGYAPLYAAFGFAEPSNHAALIIFSLISGPVLFFFTPLFSALSRRHEYQADRFAVKAVGNSQDLSEALLKLHKENLSNPVPHPWYSFFHYSHPTLLERLEAMKRIGVATGKDESSVAVRDSSSP